MHRTQWLALFCLSLLWLNSSRGVAEPVYKAPEVIVDAYGSKRLTRDILTRLYKKELKAITDAGLAMDPKVRKLQSDLIQVVKEKYALAFADWTIAEDPQEILSHDVEKTKDKLYFTLDAVDQEDVRVRMPFSLPGSMTLHEDPGGLISKWMTYQLEGVKLVASWQLLMDMAPCVALTCPFGHQHPALKPYENIFIHGARKYQSELMNISRTDRRGEYRTAALFLLAYAPDKEKVISLCLEKLHDPNDTVRNSALRLLAGVAQRYKQYIIPERPIIEALGFPRLSDRYRSLQILGSLILQRSSVKETLKRTALERLISLLEVEEPEERKLAYELLQTVSNQTYPIKAISQWKEWQVSVSEKKPLSPLRAEKRN